MFLTGQIFSNLFVKVDRFDTDCSCTLIKNILFRGVCFDDVMCMPLFFLPPPWLNVQHFTLVKYSWPAYNVWAKRHGKKRKAEAAADCEECVSVTACYLWTHRKISLHCFSCRLVSVTKAGKKLGLWAGKKKRSVYFEAASASSLTLRCRLTLTRWL